MFNKELKNLLPLSIVALGVYFGFFAKEPKSGHYEKSITNIRVNHHQKKDFLTLEILTTNSNSDFTKFKKYI